MTDAPWPKNGVLFKRRFGTFAIGAVLTSRTRADGIKRSTVTIRIPPFYTIRLPPKSRLQIESWSIGTRRKEPPELVTAEARKILINKVDLADWVPFRTLSDKDVTISGGDFSDGEDLTRVRGKKRTDYPDTHIFDLRLEDFKFHKAVLAD